jgi:hypothetical protein
MKVSGEGDFMREEWVLLIDIKIIECNFGSSEAAADFLILITK